MTEEMLGEVPETKPTEQDIKLAQFNALKDNYVRLGCRPRKEIIDRTQREIAELENAVNKYQEALALKIREIDVKREVVAAMHILPAIEVKQAEFDRLMENPDIESLSIDGYVITVNTAPIEIKYGGLMYDIGRFAIYICTDGDRGWLIRFKNLTRTVGGYHHPHIETNGAPCLGNIKACIPQMIGANQFAAAILVSIQYLKSYSNSDAGQPYVPILRWPTINKNSRVPQVKEGPSNGETG